MFSYRRQEKENSVVYQNYFGKVPMTRSRRDFSFLLLRRASCKLSLFIIYTQQESYSAVSLNAAAKISIKRIVSPV